MTMQHFDFETVVREAGVSTEKLQFLAKNVREEFPTDDMMYELHLMRVCSAIRDKYLNLEQGLNPPKAA